MVRRQTLASPAYLAIKPAKQGKGGRPAAPFHFKPRHEAILRGLHTYYFLTIPQMLHVLGFSAKSSTHAWELCNELRQQSYIKPYPFPHTVPVGRPAQVWVLDRKGCLYLRDLGLEVGTHLRTVSEPEYGYLFLKHTLFVNDLLIAASLLPRQRPSVDMAEMRHERALKRESASVPIRVKVQGEWKEKPRGVVPDGWLDFRVTDPHRKIWRQPVLLELDRGTEDQRAFREKVQALVRYAAGPYKEQFGTEFVTVAVVTTEGQKRLGDLVRWCEAELTEQQVQQEADLFRLCCLPEAFDPAMLFFAPLWRRPFDPTLTALLSEGE